MQKKDYYKINLEGNKMNNIKKMASFRIDEKYIKMLKEISNKDHRSQGEELEYLIEKRYKQIQEEAYILGDK